MNLVSAMIKVLEFRILKHKKEIEDAVKVEDYYKADKLKHTYDELMEVCQDLRDLTE